MTVERLTPASFTVILRMDAGSWKKVAMTAGHWIVLGVTVAIVALAGVVVALLIWESTRPVPILEGSSAGAAVVVVTPYQPMA